MNREQAIEAIKAGTHVLDINGYQGTKDAIEFLSKLEWYPWGASNRYYGKDKYGVINLLFKYEIKGCPIIKLSDILSESETPISETKDMREYDENLLDDYENWLSSQGHDTYGGLIPTYIDHRYPNKELEELLRQREELDKRINQLKSA